MAYHDLARPKLQPMRFGPPSHERLGGLTGALRLRYTTLPGRYVSPGSGRLVLPAGTGAEPAHAAAVLAGEPVLPGSGIKGAVRTVFELITGSCNPFDKKGPCTPRNCCDACRVFGRLGYQGRAGFGDAVVDGEGAVTASIEHVPAPHAPHGKADLRCYDLAASRHPPAQPRQVYRGRFSGSLGFRGLAADELGRILLCLGLAPDPDLRFPLRLGGVRYHGQGAMQVEPRSLFLAAGALDRETVDDPTETERRCSEWAAASLASLAPPAVAGLRTYAKTVGGGRS